MAKFIFFILFIWLFTSSHGYAENTTNVQTLAQENLVYITTDKGLVIIELAPFIAPKHVDQFKSLVNEGFYNGLDFYRVIDGFVAQGGDEGEQKQTQHRQKLKAEFTRAIGNSSDFFVIQSPEFLAEQSGFIQGFPAGRSDQDKLEWLVHCPGAVGMARNTETDSATTDFYIVIGHAPRHLDRNMSVFGQVVYGLEHIQAIHRGDSLVNSGVIEDISKRGKIIRAQIGTQIAESEQIELTRNLMSSKVFKQRIANARALSNEFFVYKGSGNIDVCYYRPSVTRSE